MGACVCLRQGRGMACAFRRGMERVFFHPEAGATRGVHAFNATSRTCCYTRYCCARCLSEAQPCRLDTRLRALQGLSRGATQRELEENNAVVSVVSVD
jgi:hypothetical protein